MQSKNLFSLFLKFSKEEPFAATSTNTMLAVSGGIDSVVMAHLFKKAGFNFSIAHCNFSLRGADADADETFVKELASRFDVPFYTKKFDTKGYASMHKVSIQMAARDLRYQWFQELHNEKLCNYIALAHHKNDNAETILINLIRGSGIVGLQGIKQQNGVFIRPLLHITREEIEKYSQKSKISFREDLSNNEDKYLRNKIRHHLIPMLESMNPSFVETLTQTACQLSDIEKISDVYISFAKEKILSTDEQTSRIHIPTLLNLTGTKTILYNILSPFNFNSAQTDDIFNALDGISGKFFLSDTHKVLKDRDLLIIEPLCDNNLINILIESNTSFNHDKLGHINTTIITKTLDFDHQKEHPLLAYINADNLDFPLVLRTWQKGDTFFPLGMNRQKKVSDFLINNKVNLFAKESQTVLCNDNDIIWLTGLRIDNRYKITSTTKQVLKIEISTLNKND